MTATTPGDILFYKVTPKSGIIARLVGAGELVAGEGGGTTLYSHVALVQDGNLQIEAVWPKVRISRFDPADPRIEVWRVTGSTVEQADKAVSWARAQVGSWYSLGAAFFGIFARRGQRNCSILINDAWCAAGIELWSQADKFLTPNDLSQSKRLVRLP